MEKEHAVKRILYFIKKFPEICYSEVAIARVNKNFNNFDSEDEDSEGIDYNEPEITSIEGIMLTESDSEDLLCPEDSEDDEEWNF